MRASGDKPPCRTPGTLNSVDMVHERTQVYNPDTGKRFKVDSGHKYYWGDGQGGYFGTDDALYDPRTDPKHNQKQWTKFETGSP